ncbi:MAG: hypothetical protein HPY64_06655 [Anaerolineae bacterium]|nr:hypothetical protein [Anaerolineae bacterium]
MTRILPSQQRFTTRAILLPSILLIQAISHLTLLHPSAHSGQLAIPWLLNQGLMLFDQVVEQHAPGGSLLVALFQQLLPLPPLTTVQLLNLILVLSMSLLIYVLTFQLEGRHAAVFALIFWTIWEPVYNNILFYYDALVGLCLILATIIWLRLRYHDRSFIAPMLVGLVLGGGTLFKQHGWISVGLFGTWLVWNERNRIFPYLFGVLLLPVICVIFFAIQGHLEAYLYWNWTYNLAGLMPTGEFSGGFLRKLLFTAILGLSYVVLVLRMKGPERSVRILVLLMGLGGTTTLIPRGDEYHVMGVLPIVSVISGSVLSWIIPSKKELSDWLQTGDPKTSILYGIMGVVALAWSLTIVAPYFGPKTTPAHDEFLPLAQELRTISQPGDTLFVLPETDSTPQIHLLTEMLPPGLWVKGWAWYFEAPGVTERLLNEWTQSPPDYVVIFPDLLGAGAPGIVPLVEFVNAKYAQVGDVINVDYHGPAVIYQYLDTVRP